MGKINDFITGNLRYYKNKFLGQPEYLKEQVFYRLYKCKDDCLPQGKCVYCSCPPHKKSWVTSSCNKEERFPGLLDSDEWDKFKKDNKIDIDTIKKEIGDITKSI